MTQANRPNFQHRRHLHGVLESVCASCVTIIDSTRNLARLEQKERAHVCDPVRIYQLHHGRTEDLPHHSGEHTTS